MNRYRSNEWEKLALGRKARRLIRIQNGEHPLSHVDPDKCYEWMRSDCAAQEAARQSREDGLISTITQVSSTALLAIPGLLFGSSQPFPKLQDSPFLYIGVGGFLATLVVAMLEQFLSGKAYQRQTDIARRYYLMQSVRTHDSEFVAWVRRCRNSACVLFGLSVFVSAMALIMLEGNINAKSSFSAAAPAASTTSAPASSTASSSTTASSTAPAVRRGVQSEVGPVINPSTSAAQTIK